ncbi:MAG: chromosome partitioning protein [Gammaproteobacteria bacterium]|nr:chromosome partitioning protein [Gammaproteobacteria bacterium]
MRTILVLNAKGGSGKTTLATNIAGYFADRGDSVALADFDVQHSSLDWLAARSEAWGEQRPAIRGLDAANQGLKVPSSVDVLVMDAPAATHAEALGALVKRAQTIVIPVIPSPVDMRAAEHFIAELMAVRVVDRHEVKIATVANRAREGTQAMTGLGEYLDALKLPGGRKLPFLATLRASVNYLKAAERGLSIFEFAPAATQVDRDCWAPLTRWLASNRSLP